jgi:hypothetical protein
MTERACHSLGKCSDDGDDQDPLDGLKDPIDQGPPRFKAGLMSGIGGFPDGVTTR